MLLIILSNGSSITYNSLSRGSNNPNNSILTTKKKIYIYILLYNTWFCESNQTAYEKPENRYILPLCVADASGQQWISAFDEPARIIIGKSADEMQALMYVENPNPKIFFFLDYIYIFL